jgi:hypothetical protein
MNLRTLVAVTSAIAMICCVLILAVATFAGSSEKQQLEACSTDTEPTLLLRQLNLDTAKKTRFNECVVTHSKFKCQAVYLDRHGLLDACMRRNGFAATTPLQADCLVEPVATCYRRKWLEGIHSVIASN